MENQEQKQETVQQPVVATSTFRLSSYSRVVYGVMVTGLLFSLGGVILGANNFVGPAAHYPSLLLATWLVVDVLLVLLMLIQIIVYGMLDNNSDAFNTLMTIGSIILIGGTLLLIFKHFAFLSVFSLFILVAMLIADITIMAGERK